MGAKTDRLLGSVADIAFGQPLVADPTAPTVAEVTALTRIECDIVGSETIETPRTGSAARIDSICEKESAEIAAFITNGTITGQGYRHFDGTDGFYVLMDDDVTVGPQSMVICRGGFSGAAGAPDAGDTVDVYTVEVQARAPIGPRQTTAQMFSFELAVLNVEYNIPVVA